MNQPLVSIIIANYNNAHYLKACLESCIAQTYRNIEVVVVDDCSTDSSVETVEQLQKGDKRIVLIRNKENQKVARTRNIGFEQCRADWVTTLDSDDIFYPEKIEKEMAQVAASDFNPKLIAYSDTMLLDDVGTIISAPTGSRPEGKLYTQILTRSIEIPRDFTFFKSRYFDVGGYDPDIPVYEDWDLKIRLAKEGIFKHSGTEGTGYRRHGEGLSSQRSRNLHWLQEVFQKNAIELEDYKKWLFAFNLETNPHLKYKILRKFRSITN